MIISKEISNLMGILGRLQKSIDDLGRTVFNGKSKVIENLNMATLYIKRAIEALREE